MSVVVNHDGLGDVADKLREAGTELDGSTANGPSSVDAGLATDLVGAILATTADVVSRLAYEVHHLAGLADDCNAAYTADDDSAAASISALIGTPQ